MGPTDNEGKQIPELIVKDFLRAPDIGKVQVTSFIEDRLIKGVVDFFTPIKKNKLFKGIKKKVKTKKAVEVLKEDCQAFGTIIAKSYSLREAFGYPITSYPLSVADLEGSLRQSDKASFRNMLIEEANAASKTIPKNASWIVDGMGAVRALKPQKIYETWIEGLLKFITPLEITEALSTGMVNDTYPKLSAKNGVRIQRGEEFVRTHVEGIGQQMPNGIRWQEFLKNGENKEQLIKLVKEYALSAKGKKLVWKPFLITSGDRNYKLMESGEVLEEECNHEEADTRLVYLALQGKTDMVVVSKDTDVLILLVWAYAKHDIKTNWYMMYEQGKYADIGKIVEFLGKEICLALPAFHSLTGCDTISFVFFFVLAKLVSSKNF